MANLLSYDMRLFTSRMVDAKKLSALLKACPDSVHRDPKFSESKIQNLKSKIGSPGIEPELIADYACETGEGPLWHPIEQRLYWLDIPAGRLFRYDPVSDVHELCFEGEPVGGITLQADGSLLFFMARGAVRCWRDGALTTMLDEIPEERNTRFNDVIADPLGGVFCGTMPTDDRPGHLYRMATDGSVRLIEGDLGVSNGMGFTPDRKGMYHTDSTRCTIYRYDFDPVTGDVSDRRVFDQVAEGEGSPDGLTVDAEGCVWSARWDGSCVVRYAPDGTQLMRIPIPTPKVSSLTFGGSDYTDIYVTTAGGENREANGPEAGALYRVNVGILGVAEFPSRIGLLPNRRQL
ncbi:MAG TPA: SMP-30/gluconolactonase/LRE family protein [Rhodothermales bacterium]|nr:SMP-30/gluconolactonase/LRE family protein [Rhodothermales bacterium]